MHELPLGGCRMTPPAGARLTVGVLGGMGPAATLDFFARLLAATPAERDQDHLHVLIDNRPQVPDRNEAAAGRGPSPAPVLVAMARSLQSAGADMLVMPCNAAHAWAGAVVAAADVPFVDMVRETARATARAHTGSRRVGVLAAAGARDAGLYPAAFAEHGFEVLEPDGTRHEAFMDVLYRIKRGERGRHVRAAMRDLALALVAAGAEVLVAGCTEVPLVLDQADVPVSLMSSTEVLVEATVAYATGARALADRA